MDIFFGSLAEEYRGLLNIRYPMEHGIVRDWNDMEKIWHHVYSKNQLNSNSEEVRWLTGWATGWLGILSISASFILNRLNFDSIASSSFD